MKGFDGLDGVAFEDVGVAEGFHGEDADALLECDRHDLFGEGAEVCVHDVDGHLNGVEVEVVLLRGFEHAEMDGGILVAGEADVADLSGLTSRRWLLPWLRRGRRCDRGLRGG